MTCLYFVSILVEELYILTQLQTIVVAAQAYGHFSFLALKLCHLNHWSCHLAVM